MRQDHPAGDKVFVDYSGKKIMIVDRATGVVREAEIFVAVLGASNYTYAEAMWTQKLADWIEAHVRRRQLFGVFSQAHRDPQRICVVAEFRPSGEHRRAESHRRHRAEDYQRDPNAQVPALVANEARRDPFVDDVALLKRELPALARLRSPRNTFPR
jgi:transposase